MFKQVVYVTNRMQQTRYNGKVLCGPRYHHNYSTLSQILKHNIRDLVLSFRGMPDNNAEK